MPGSRSKKQVSNLGRTAGFMRGMPVRLRTNAVGHGATKSSAITSGFKRCRAFALLLNTEGVETIHYTILNNARLDLIEYRIHWRTSGSLTIDCGRLAVARPPVYASKVM